MKISGANASRLARIAMGAVVVFSVFMLGTQWLRPHSQRGGANVGAGNVLRADAAGLPMARFLLDRVRRDPEDFIAQNMLAGHLLQRLRETGNADFLEGAKRAAGASLASVPASRNPGGLSNLARTEIAAHEFTKARADAARLTEIDPGTAGSYSVLFDAVVELGDYTAADEAMQHMRKLASDNTETDVRLARLLFLRGDSADARHHMFRAVSFARNTPVAEPETIAWCEWQSGELEFYEGRYAEAERHYREALNAFPNYAQALAALGRARAAQGDLPNATARYEEAVRRFPDPTFVAALGDLYHLSGRDDEAGAQYALVDKIGRLSASNGVRYNRQIAVFYADHDRQPQQAYEDARREYANRRDIYGADALAWAALKAGKLPEAQWASKEALRLGTRDARLLYHAGLIAKAAGDGRLTREYLKSAVALSPAFDPLQAPLARKALGE